MSSHTPASTNDLPQLLAGDADRAGLDLQPGDCRDLVRLDVRPVGDAMPVEMALHPVDIVRHPVQQDGHCRRIELTERGHRRSFPSSRATNGDGPPHESRHGEASPEVRMKLSDKMEVVQRLPGRTSFVLPESSWRAR
jgi:hypothetical protein